MIDMPAQSVVDGPVHGRPLTSNEMAMLTRSLPLPGMPLSDRLDRMTDRLAAPTMRERIMTPEQKAETAVGLAISTIVEWVKDGLDHADDMAETNTSVEHLFTHSRMLAELHRGMDEWVQSRRRRMHGTLSEAPDVGRLA